jgi:hypothetical protein
MFDLGKSPRTSNLAMPCQESISRRIPLKLGIGLLICVVLFAACGGSSSSAPDLVATAEAPAAREITDKITPSPGTQSAEETKAATSVPVATGTPTDVVKAAQSIPTIVPAATQVPGVPTLGVTVTPSPATTDPGSSDSCEVLTGNDKATCEEMMKSGTGVGDMVADPCASYSGAAKAMCQQMVQTGTGSQHGSGSGGDRGISNPCAQLSGDNKARCEKEIANDPIFGGSGSGFVQSFDPNNIPKVARFNFSELDKVGRTSKFRSVTGHDFSFNTSEYDPTGMNCRSMKHYMVPVGVPRENAIYHLTPHTFEWMSIKFFAPADGIIGDVVHSQSHGEPESQFTVGSTEYPGYFFGFYHVKLDPSLSDGSEVKAGQQIGTLGNEESYAEISVEARINSREIHLLSFLEVATDEVFEEYKERGVNAVSDVIITKEERDANPIACDRNSEAGWFEGSYKYKANEAFMTWVFESSDNWVFFD